MAVELTGSRFFVQPGSYMAGDPGLAISVQGTMRGMLSGEGLFLLTVEGSGLLLLSSFGAIHSKTLRAGEEYIVDTGHIVAFEGSVGYRIEKATGKARVLAAFSRVWFSRPSLARASSAATGGPASSTSRPGNCPASLNSSSPSCPGRAPEADGRTRSSSDELFGGCESERCKLVKYLGVEVGDWRAYRAGNRSHPVHLPEVIDGPGRKDRAERLGRRYRDQPVARSFQLAHQGMQPLERPGYLGARRISGQAETGDVQRLNVLAMEPAGGTSSNIQETSGIEPQQLEQTIDAANLELGEIGEVRSQVRRADGGEAEHPFSPVGVCKQTPGVEPSHTMTDDVNRLIGKGSEDPIAQPPGSKLHPAIGWTRVTSTRFPAARSASGIPRK